MNFDFDNERPIYVQLVEKLRFAIITGYYEVGSRLPSVRELALTVKVNPNTLQKALSELEQEKLIYTERTNGKYITSDNDLIAKKRNDLAEEITKKYLIDMTNIGIDLKTSIKYLQELGGKNDLTRM